jgi:hypothetical protein
MNEATTVLEFTRSHQTIPENPFSVPCLSFSILSFFRQIMGRNEPGHSSPFTPSHLLYCIYHGTIYYASEQNSPSFAIQEPSVGVAGFSGGSNEKGARHPVDPRNKAGVTNGPDGAGPSEKARHAEPLCAQPATSDFFHPIPSTSAIEYKPGCLPVSQMAARRAPRTKLSRLWAECSMRTVSPRVL